VIKDLVGDQTHIIAQYSRSGRGCSPRARIARRERLQSEDERAQLDGLGNASSASAARRCPSYWWNSERYLGRQCC